MTEFAYRNGELCAEGVSLRSVAEAVGTPLYCYSTAAIEHAYKEFAAAFAGRNATICYSLKSNGNLAVVRTLAGLGAGADVVSGGELRRALAAGIPAEKIVFSGVGKTRDELALAVETGIGQINVESESELRALSTEAVAQNARAPIAIRVNPDVDAETHEKITTGLKYNKFGIDAAEAPRIYRLAAELPGIEITGIAVHIGSQLTSLEPFRAAFRRVAELARALRDECRSIHRLDLGGGLGITYRGEAPPSIADYAEVVAETTAGLDCELVFEPGRRIVGNAGVLLSRVVAIKDTPARNFVIVDAGMNDLMRPALYEAAHHVMPLRETTAAPRPVDLVGPICETTDIFAEDLPLPPMTEGDLLAFASAGAYGAVMASSYNSRQLVPEVLINGDDWAVVRVRPSIEETLAAEPLPDWLEAPAKQVTRTRGAA